MCSVLFELAASHVRARLVLSSLLPDSLPAQLPLVQQPPLVPHPSRLGGVFACLLVVAFGFWKDGVMVVGEFVRFFRYMVLLVR